MGLIKAGIGALGGTLADQWKEFFYCESLDKEIMMTKGQKRVSGRSSANTRRPQNTGSFKSEIICRTVASDMAAVFVSTRSPLLDLIDFDSS